MSTTQELIQELTQSIIAIMVVVGSGYALIFTNGSHDAITGVLGTVVGWYFTKSVYGNATNAANAANAAAPPAKS